MIPFLICAFLALVFMSMVFAKWAHDQEPRRRMFEEKRRVLERDRKEWLSTAANPLMSMPQRQVATNRVVDIDKELLKLADEEAHELRPTTVWKGRPEDDGPDY